jgi:hypothetical protein
MKYRTDMYRVHNNMTMAYETPETNNSIIHTVQYTV